MKKFRTYLALVGLFILSALSINAAQLASAKVIEVIGTVTKDSEVGGKGPLRPGDILTQGDSISVTALSSAKLVFSNGSELTVKENTSVAITELAQDPFGGDNSYEQLEADPSKSQTLLELNYGEVSGHVKKLQQGSKFFIKTPLGTAAIRGTNFTVKLYYNPEIGEFLLQITNADGYVDVISSYDGDFEFGKGNISDKVYNSNLGSDRDPEPIPETKTVVIRLSRYDPSFTALFDMLKNYIPTEPSPGWIELAIPVVTPEDPGVTIVSPEDDAG
jgi:hypothetical protein